MQKLERTLISLLLSAGLAAPQLVAQTVPPLTVQEVLARGINGTEAQQMRPIPHKIVGNLYYVGSETLSSFLVTTPQGHILINSNFERNVPLIKASVEKLGFSFKDIKILLTSHGHIDHVEGDAMVKQLTGAQVMVMAEDVAVEQKITPGGKPHPIDRIFHDREEVALGGTTLVAHLTPAHTPGCTTWTTPITEAGKTYNVVILGCGIGTGPLVDANGKVTEGSGSIHRHLQIAPNATLRHLPGGARTAIQHHGEVCQRGQCDESFHRPRGLQDRTRQLGKVLRRATRTPD